MYGSLLEILSEDELDGFVEEMVVDLAERRPDMDGQDLKITKTALRQVQDLVSLRAFLSSSLLILICRQRLWDELMSI